MRWFKHDSDAHRDAKLKRVIMKYGMEGYGLYFYCVELIAGTVDQHNITFELEHDAEIIAHDTGIHYERVQEMMVYMVNLGLFEENDGVVTCLKLAKRLDQSMTSNPQMRQVINDLQSHDPIMTPSRKRQPRLDQTRREKKYMSNSYESDFLEFWEIYPRKEGKLSASKAWKKLTDKYKAEAVKDISSRFTDTPKQYVPHAATYLNGRRWEDEIDTGSKKFGEGGI